MEIPTSHQSLLKEFGTLFGRNHATLAPNDLTQVVRRTVPSFLKIHGITGNHDDRQALKDIATEAAHQTVFGGEQPVV